jgi:hypothetical protein
MVTVNLFFDILCVTLTKNITHARSQFFAVPQKYVLYPSHGGAVLDLVLDSIDDVHSQLSTVPQSCGYSRFSLCAGRETQVFTWNAAAAAGWVRENRNLISSKMRAAQAPKSDLSWKWTRNIRHFSQYKSGQPLTKT